MNLLLIDDHKMFAEGLKQSLEKSEAVDSVDIEMNIELAKVIIQSDKHDIILIDIGIKKLTGNQNGLELAEELLNQKPDLNIVNLTAYDLPWLESESKRIGTKGFISKEVSTSELIEKLERIVGGENVFREKNRIGEKLTKRELQIVRIYYSGKTRKEVSQELGISTTSLSVALNRIYEKLQVNNYQELCREIIKLGYIVPEK